MGIISLVLKVAKVSSHTPVLSKKLVKMHLSRSFAPGTATD